MNFPSYVSRKTCRQKQQQSEDGAVRKLTGPLVFHWRGFMSLLLFPSPKRISASSLSQPMRPTTCSYKKRTSNGQYECLNRRGIAFDDRRGGGGVEQGGDLYGRPCCPNWRTANRAGDAKL